MIAMRWDKVFLQLLHTGPLFIIPLSATDHIFQLDTWWRKWLQVVHREYLIESLLERLDLDLYCLMEEIVHGKIQVFLQIIQSDVRFLSICLKLQVIEARKDETQG